MLEAALLAAARGWSVVPVRPRAKAPLVPWTEWQERRAGEEEIRGWFRRWPDANLGVVTGAVSGLVVLDVDPRHGGRESLAALEAKHAPLPATIEALTGGGRHYYFAHPGGTVPNRAGVEPGIDVRGDGGSIVMPPSVHPSGRRYRWAAGRSPGGIAPAALPRWLASRILRRPRAGGGHPAAHWRELLHRGVEEGARNDAVASLTGHLLWRGVDPYVVLELLLCWNRARCNPPLSDEEVSRTVASIVRLHAESRESRSAARRWVRVGSGPSASGRDER